MCVFDTIGQAITITMLAVHGLTAYCCYAESSALCIISAMDIPLLTSCYTAMSSMHRKDACCQPASAVGQQHVHRSLHCAGFTAKTHGNDQSASRSSWHERVCCRR